MITSRRMKWARQGRAGHGVILDKGCVVGMSQGKRQLVGNSWTLEFGIKWILRNSTGERGVG